MEHVGLACMCLPAGRPAGRSVDRQRIRDIFRYVNKYKVDWQAFLGYKGLCNCLCIIGTGKLLTATVYSSDYASAESFATQARYDDDDSGGGGGGGGAVVAIAMAMAVAASTSACGALQGPPRSATSPYIDPAVAVGKRTGAPAPMCAYEI